MAATINDLRYQYYATALGIPLDQAIRQSVVDLEYQALVQGALSGGGSPVAVRDEGTQFVAATNKLNFIGAGVTATTDGAGGANITVPGGSGGPPLVLTAIKTGSYIAAAGEYVQFDTTSTTPTLTLPTAPPSGTQVGAKIVTFTNPVNVVCGGTDVFNKVGGPAVSNSALIYNNQGVFYVYSNGIWSLASNAAAFGVMDNRYVQVANQVTLQPGQDLDMSAVVGGVQTMGVTNVQHSFWQPLFYRATTDGPTVTNSNSVVDDTGFALTLAASSTYHLEGILLHDSPTTGDFRYQFVGPAGSTMDLFNFQAHSSEQTNPQRMNMVANPNIMGTSMIAGSLGSGTIAGLQLDGIVITSTTVGPLQLRYAQGTVDVGNTIRKAGSWMSLRRVA